MENIGILQKSKMEDVNHPIAISFWGHCPLVWLFLPFVGRYGGVVIIRDSRVSKLVDSKIWTYTYDCKFKFLEDNFVWGIIGVYGPNDDNLRFC